MSSAQKKIMLSFDIEEFDMPEEYGKTISFEEKISVSTKGTTIILDLLKKHNIEATFFSTVEFAKNALALIERINEEGHELASHGCFHSSFNDGHLSQSKIELEKLSGQKINGFRMPRMMGVSNQAAHNAGYHYNSSLNPVYLPGRYNNFFKPRTLFITDSIIQLPASAVPYLRFPLFWLSFHNLPLSLYKAACSLTLRHDRYLNIYFHPWEFTDLTRSEYNMPNFVSKNSGMLMEQRFNSLVEWLKQKQVTFCTITNFLNSQNRNDIPVY
jgi:hypothetical protein